MGKILKACLLLTVTLAMPSPVLAITVTSFEDGSDQDLSDKICQASSGACSLRAAIENGFSSIELTAGIYKLANGPLEISTDHDLGMRIFSSKKEGGIPKIDSSNQSRVFHLKQGKLTLEGVEVRSGAPQLSEVKPEYGGCVLSELGTLLNLSRSSFTDCGTEKSFLQDGSAVAAFGLSRIKTSVFIGNGTMNLGAVLMLSSVFGSDVDGCIFKNNKGAIFSSGKQFVKDFHSVIHITRSLIEENSATSVFISFFSANLQVSDVTIRNNNLGENGFLIGLDGANFSGSNLILLQNKMGTLYKTSHGSPGRDSAIQFANSVFKDNQIEGTEDSAFVTLGGNLIASGSPLEQWAESKDTVSDRIDFRSPVPVSLKDFNEVFPIVLVNPESFEGDKTSCLFSLVFGQVMMEGTKANCYPGVRPSRVF